MAKCKVVSGLNDKTMQNLVFDAGAFFKDFNFETDTFETAVEAGKLLGATKGGGSFKAVPTFRSIKLDGMRGAAKGTKILEAWEISMGANIAEVTPETIKTGLGVSVSEQVQEEKEGYTKITGKMCVGNKDYIGNITWVGNLSGAKDLVVIQIFNALNTKGIEFSFEDKGELVVETEFVAHFDMTKMNEVPFVIYYPKIEEEV